jgi:hypothetical protein
MGVEIFPHKPLFVCVALVFQKPVEKLFVYHRTIIRLKKTVPLQEGKVFFRQDFPIRSGTTKFGYVTIETFFFEK